MLFKKNTMSKLRWLWCLLFGGGHVEELSIITDRGSITDSSVLHLAGNLSGQGYKMSQKPQWQLGQKCVRKSVDTRFIITWTCYKYTVYICGLIGNPPYSINIC
jgi:hypothetical protein